VLLLAALAWSGVWMIEKWRLEHDLAARPAEWRRLGWDVQWSSAKVEGWPFRLRVTLAAPKAADRAGWVVTAPRIEAMALAYDPDRWVLAAPEGLTLTRPGQGAVNVSGQAVRASVGGLGSKAPRFSFEGDNLSLTTPAGAPPAAFSTIDKLEAHLQPGPDDQAALLLKLEGAALRPEAGLAKLAGGKPITLTWDSRLTRLSSFQGQSWPQALQAWATSGGMMTVVDARLGLGGLAFQGAGGPLTVDTDNRLAGSFPLKLDANQAPGQALLQALGLLGPVSLSFQAGHAAIGPVPIGDALKVG
jgi:hypothetical protein